jgi:hypothetical protein
MGVAMRAFLDHLNGQLVVAIVVALFTMVAYVLTRRRELAWKRTEFLFAQAHYFENDPVLVEVVMILEGRHSGVTTDQIFDAASELDASMRQQYLQKFDKFLDFLWRLCFACLETKTLSLKEIEAFGWWLWRISDNSVLFDYCDNYGFEEIVMVIKKLQPVWAESDRVDT